MYFSVGVPDQSVVKLHHLDVILERDSLIIAVKPIEVVLPCKGWRKPEAKMTQSESEGFPKGSDR